MEYPGKHVTFGYRGNSRVSVSNYSLPARQASGPGMIDHHKVARLTLQRIAANAEFVFWLQWIALLVSLIAFVAAAVTYINHIPTVS